MVFFSATVMDAFSGAAVIQVIPETRAGQVNASAKTTIGQRTSWR